MDAVSECRPAIQALVARILRRKREDPDVEDCTHEVFRRALEGSHRLRDSEPVKPWLLGTARHVALDLLRAQHRARSRAGALADPADAGVVQSVEMVADHGSGPEALAAHSQRAELLRAALQRLPEQQREALLLFHVEDLGYREIAAKLGVPVGTVGTWVLRARQGLAHSLRLDTLQDHAPETAVGGKP